MSVNIPRAAIAALALWGCGGTTPSGPQAGDNQILATTSLQFSPANKSVEVGSALVWKFGSVAHSVQFDPVAGHPLDIAAVSNQSVSRTFGQVGTYPFGCTIHPAMRGTVRVVAIGSGPPPPPPPPPPTGPYY